jgi:hypothetical protein
MLRGWFLHFKISDLSDIKHGAQQSSKNIVTAYTACFNIKDTA